MNRDPKKSGRPPDQQDGDNKQPRTILMLIVAALIFTVFINSIYQDIANSQYQEITYDQFMTLLDEDQLAEVQFQSDRILILTKEEAAKNAREQTIYYTGLIPNLDLNSLQQALDDFLTT